MSGWIGVDLDGTLAKFEFWAGIHNIGEPIPLMVERIKQWLKLGIEVRIMTARVSYSDECDNYLARTAIKKWLKKHDIPELRITNRKDFDMVALWDDRCVPIELNTGKIKLPKTIDDYI